MKNTNAQLLKEKHSLIASNQRYEGTITRVKADLEFQRMARQKLEDQVESLRKDVDDATAQFEHLEEDHKILQEKYCTVEDNSEDQLERSTNTIEVLQDEVQKSKAQVTLHELSVVFKYLTTNVV